MNKSIEARLRKLEAVNDPAVLFIVGYDFTECRLRGDALEAEGKLEGRKPQYIATGVRRSEGWKSGHEQVD